jgi:predicted Fe-Mo cluster-binding NifX family protein
LQSLKVLDNQQIDAVIVGGIGTGALNRLNQSGIKVYRAQSQTVQEIWLCSRQSTFWSSRARACGGHSHGGGCAH